MLNRVRIESPDDLFADLGKRRNKGVYFCRVNGYNDTIHDIILRFHEAARQNGVIIEGKLHNPDNNNLAYYNEMMGMDFQLDAGFINQSLAKWLPRMTPEQRSNVTAAMFRTLVDLSKQGKNENMLKNTYIKFMCWLYYKFERIVNKLGTEKLPKILYEGEISSYELLLMNVLSLAGSDIMLLQYNGDDAYKKADPDLSMSDELVIGSMASFPIDFNLKKLRQEMVQNPARTAAPSQPAGGVHINLSNIQRPSQPKPVQQSPAPQPPAQQEPKPVIKLDGQRVAKLLASKPMVANCTNVWIKGRIIDELKKPVVNRGDEERFFYNCFCRISGVEDKVTYLNDLFQLQLTLKTNGRQMVIINNAIEPPSNEEIAKVKRANYASCDQLLVNLVPNLYVQSWGEMNKLIQWHFLDFMQEESKVVGGSVPKLTSKGVYLICWLKRFKRLFENWKMPDVSCFFYLGGCRNENEEMLCRFLARLPVDVVLFCPDLNRQCTLRDDHLYEEHYNETLKVDEFPEAGGSIRVATAAYHAERELDTLMYQDTGMYRNNQYGKANTICLQTMYEEIEILWDQELKYRPNFSTIGDEVVMPVIFAKVSGVKDGDIAAYWSSIKRLITSDTMVIKDIPHIMPNAMNPVKQFATDFFRNGRLQKQKIKEHPVYQYSFLRESVQEHILEKLQYLIDQRLIKGTFENGTEYTIVATVLNLEKNIVRLIQKFDFTKKNPKLIFIMTGENMLSLEDTILVAFLDLIGFDIVFFVPTGYQSVERYFAKEMIEEHQAGEFMYDLRIPDMNSISANAKRRLRDKFFKRGK